MTNTQDNSMEHAMNQASEWNSVGAKNPKQPGIYEVKFSWPSNPVMQIAWDGEKWVRNGKFKPSQTWADKWRPCTTQ